MNEDTLTCGECKYVITSPIDCCDSVGACPGNVFCLECDAEIDASTGKKGKHCGDCHACNELEIMKKLERIRT